MSRGLSYAILALLLLVTIAAIAGRGAYANRNSTPVVTNRVDPRNHGMQSVCFEGIYLLINNEGHMIQPVGYKGTGIRCDGN